MIAACATNGPPFSSARSPISSTDMMASTTMAPCRNSEGPSIAIAWPAVTTRVSAWVTSTTSAATRPASDSTSWVR